MNERMTNDERTSGAGITEELRDWSMDAHAGWIISRVELDALHAIADRIDEQHAKAVEQAHADGLNEQIDYLERFVPSNYVLLPVDEDGVPIHVGDVMEWPDGSTFDVVGISANTLFYVEHDFDDSAQWTAAHNKRHHKPDSWERIMDDAEKLARDDNVAVMELVERCRRLAGEGE